MAEHVASRLLKAIIRLIDDNLGTRASALTAVETILQRPDFNIHQYRLIRDTEPDTDLLRRNTEALKLLRQQCEYLADERRRLKVKLAHTERELADVRAESFALNNGTALQIADLRQKLAAAERKVADLTAEAAHNTYDPPAPDRTDMTAEAEEDMAKHPWLAPVKKYIKYIDRVPTFELLDKAVGIPETHQSTDDGRILSLVMMEIGGWKQSTNIRIFPGRSVRGYIRR